MKLLVAIPTGEITRFSRFTDYVNMLKLPKGNGSVLTYARGSSPAKNRNILIQIALDGDFSHILFLDDDLALPVDTFERLYSHDKDMVTGLYLTRNYPHRPIIFDLTLPDGACAWHYLEEGEKGLIPVVAAGLGCCLIKIEVFKALQAPWVTLGQLDQENWNDDIHFFNKATEVGFKLFCDLDLFCGHMGTVSIFPHRTSDGKWLVSYDTMGTGNPSFLMEKMTVEERLEREKICLSV